MKKYKNASLIYYLFKRLHINTYYNSYYYILKKYCSFLGGYRDVLLVKNTLRNSE